MISLLYNAGLLLSILLAAPLLLVRPRWREGLRERLGAGAKRVGRSPRLVWVHAVSVGEVMAITRLVTELDRQVGADAVCISTTTRTGQQLAKTRFGAERCFYMPLDLPWAVRRALCALRPSLLLLAESELWPNLLAECERTGAALLVVNARISDRSLPRYQRLRALWAPYLRKLTLVLAQSAEDARRFVAVGVPAERVHIGGNLKYDAHPLPASALVQQLRARLAPDARVLVAGSTLENEEAMLLDAWPAICAQVPGAVMLLAPRHPERFTRVFELVQQRGFPLLRRSTWNSTDANSGMVPAGAVFLLDSIGELSAVYELAEVAFVGGSLVHAGGHNPLEPARFAKPVLMGPHYENFRDIVERLRAAGGLTLVNCPELELTIASWLLDRARAAESGARGREVFTDQAGATDRAVAAAMRLLGRTIL